MINVLSDFKEMWIVATVIWGLIIILSLIIEFNTADLTAIWFGVAAIPPLICAILKVGVSIQIIVFAILSVIFVLVTRPIVKKFNQRETIATNSDKIIGAMGKITKAIPVDGKGEVKVEFQTWTAFSKSSIEIPLNSTVIIKEIVGNKLLVEKVDEIKL